MNIYLSCTPEFSNEKLEEVVSLLENISGELKFIKCDPFTPAQFRRLCTQKEDVNQIQSFSFEEYFDLIQAFRETTKTPENNPFNDDEFLIVISSIRHNLNWFSAFKKRNIFVHGLEWDLISDVDSKFGIAYECVENIFQSLIDLDIANYRQEPNIHMTSIGCINDFCGPKKEILNKLQSANICPSCYQRSLKKGVSDLVMTQIVSIMEEIRKEFVISKKFTKQASLEKVRVDEKGNIIIAGKMIKMELLPKVMYIGFLNKIDGIPSDKKCEKKDLFEEIYQIIKRNPDKFAIQKMFCGTIKHEKSIERRKTTFETNRSKIKMAIKAVLGQTLANYYSVNLVEDKNKQSLFKVNLKKEQLEISPNFTKSII
jgi:hypothetical protein